MRYEKRQWKLRWIDLASSPTPFFFRPRHDETAKTRSETTSRVCSISDDGSGGPQACRRRVSEAGLRKMMPDEGTDIGYKKAATWSKRRVRRTQKVGRSDPPIKKKRVNRTGAVCTRAPCDASSMVGFTRCLCGLLSHSAVASQEE